MTVAKKPATSRTYRSALREEQARRTRAVVLDAAAECFVEQGYATTTMKDVAARAGVSVETVYAQGGKKTLLLAVVDRTLTGDDEPVPLIERPELQEVVAAPSPRETLRGLADLIAAGLGPTLPVMCAFERAAGADAEIAAVHAEYDRRRRADMARFAAALAPGLRPGVTEDEAADVLATIVSAVTADLLATTYGWGVERYARWVADAAERLLLAEEPGAGD
jgi:AcrR family transcriptional regulator